MKHDRTIRHLKKVHEIWPMIQPLDRTGDERWAAIRQAIENTERLRVLENLQSEAAKRKGKK